MSIPEITKPVKMWVQNALPLVFDDSLSYYEVLAKFTTYINKLIDDVSELAGSIGDYDSDIAELRTELSDVNSEIDNIKNDIQNVESDMSGINERINGVVTRVDSIESTITSINNSVTNLQSDVESLNGRVATAETSVANLGQAVNEAETAVSDVISAQTLQENRISALERNVNDVDQNISALQTMVGQHGTDISTLQTTVGQHGTDISMLQTTVGQHGTDISTLQTNINSNTQNIQNQESELSDLKSALNNKATAIYETVGPAAVASISDGADGMPVKKLLVNIEPVQSSNDGSITGRTGCNVYVLQGTDAQAITYPVSWASAAGMVYGGTLDVTTGELTVDRLFVEVDDTAAWTMLSPGKFFCSSLTTGADTGDSAITKYMSNLYPFNGSGNSQSSQITADKYFYGQAKFGRIYVFDSDYQTLEDFKTMLHSTPLQVVYPIASPIPYQLTPEEQENITLHGINNIWADCGNVTVEYQADTALYIQNAMSASDDALPISVCHRCLATIDYPENTIVALKDCINHGWEWVETDIRMTQDGTWVLLHDPTINRTARNADGSTISETISIDSITYAQALEYDFGIYAGAQFAGTKIPTLEEFLTLCRRAHVYVQLEVKSSSWTQAQMDTAWALVNKYGMEDRVCWLCSSAGGVKKILRRYPKASATQTSTAAWVYIDPENFSSNSPATTLEYSTGQNKVFWEKLLSAFGSVADQDNFIDYCHYWGIYAGVYCPTTAESVNALSGRFDIVCSQYYPYSGV